MKHKFYNLQLSYNNQIALTELYEARKPLITDVLQTGLEKGLKISFSYDGYHDTGLMSLTHKDKQHPFYGYVVSVRHDDLETLVKVLYWLEAGAWEQIPSPEKESGEYSW